MAVRSSGIISAPVSHGSLRQLFANAAIAASRVGLYPRDGVRLAVNPQMSG